MKFLNNSKVISDRKLSRMVNFYGEKITRMTDIFTPIYITEERFQELAPPDQNILIATIADRMSDTQSLEYAGKKNKTRFIRRILDEILDKRPDLADAIWDAMSRANQDQRPFDRAMKGILHNPGGIDLTRMKVDSRRPLGTPGTRVFRGNDIDIKFHIDLAQLAQLKDALGFVPVIISIHPLTSLTQFLGTA
jgi:hypothetical protein